MNGAKSTHVATRTSFDEVLSAHGPSLARVAHAYARTQDEREDLLQEIALALFRALPRFRGESSARTFVFRVAHNVGLAFACRRRPAVEEADESVPDPAPSAEARATAHQERELLRAAIQRLPVAQRQVLVLALEDVKHGEIAEILGITEDNVNVRLSRARAELTKLLRGAS